MRSKEKSLDMIPAKIFYKEENELIDEFCSRVKCGICNGTDLNGEPNGYGCELMEKWIEKWNNLIG